jgi:hypothetical protein
VFPCYSCYSAFCSHIAGILQRKDQQPSDRSSHAPNSAFTYRIEPLCQSLELRFSCEMPTGNIPC